MNETLTICAVGDVRVDHKKVGRPTPEAAFEHCAHVFQAADISFFNCEANYTDRGVPVPAQHTPGSTPPENFRAMAWAGFNVAGLANNHGLDLGVDGLLDTIELCRAHGVATSGAGRTIDEARRPAIVERKGTKVAFLSYNCVGPNEYAARHDRPGVAPLRASTLYQAMEYQPGTPPRILTFADREDLAAMERDVAQARAQADVVVTNFHWGMHHVQAMICMYQREVAYAALDAGADLVLGGHDHVVKGVEVYRGKAIFYGLGDFVLDTPITEKTETAWRKLKQLLYDLRYDRDYPAYPFPPESRHHLIVKCLVQGGKIVRVSYLPCTVNTMGQPLVLPATDPRSDGVAGYIDAISRHEGFNVQLVRDGDEIVVRDGGTASRPIGPAVTRFLVAPVDPV